MHDSICYSDEINLTASGAGEKGMYSWNTGIMNDVLTVSPLSTTQYTVVGTDEFGCAKDTSFIVGVIPLPSFEIKGQELICQNDTNKIWIEYEDKSLTFEWGGNYEMDGDTIYPKVENNESYLVTATDPYQCSKTKSLAVKVKPYPVLEDDAVTEVCLGSPVKITVTGATDYKWTGDVVWNTFTDIPEQDTVYYVYGTTNGCTTYKEYPITILPLPVITITGKTHDLCSGQSMPLTADGAKSYIWSTGKASNRIDIRPTSTTEYIVTGTDYKGCEDTASFLVNVRPLPQISIDGDYSVCEGSDAKLFVVPGGNTSPLKTYIWKYDGNDIGDQDTIYTEIKTTQNINLRVIDIYDCEATANTTVKSKPYPNLVVPENDTVCNERTITLTVAGANAYEWQDNGYAIENDANTLTKKMDAIGSQQFKVRGTTDGCTSEWYDMNVEVVDHPIVTIEGDAEVCINDFAKLTARGVHEGTYIWSEGSQGDSIKIKPMATTTYSVIGYDKYGCEGTAEMKVNVNFPAEISIDGPKSVCSDAGDLTLTVINNSDKMLTYTWLDNNSHSAIRRDYITEPTEYRVKAEDDKKCVSYAEHTVSITKIPSITLTGNMHVCEDEQIVISAFGTATEYLWSNGTEVNQLNTLAVFNDATAQGNTSTRRFRVYGTLNGCENHVDTTVVIYKKPQLSYEGNTTLCQGEELSITGYGAKLYSWSNGVNTQTLTARPNNNTRYTLIGIGDNECRSAIDIPVTVFRQPEFSISGDRQACRGTSAKLQAEGTGITYRWGFGNDDCEDAESGNGASIFVPVVGSETQVFVRAFDVNNCTATKTTKIKTLEPPTLTCNGKTEVCAGESVNLTAQGASSYYWVMGGDTTRGMNFSFRPEENTTVNLHGTLGECSSDMDVYIHAKPAPNLTITGKDTICKGEEVELIARGALRFYWPTTGDSTNSITKRLQNSMTYTVRGIGYNECSAIVSKTVHVNQLPAVRMFVKKDGCPESETKVDLSARGAKYYTWSSEPAIMEIITSMEDSIFGAVIDQPTRIIVHGVDENNCKSTDTSYVEPVPFEPIKFQVSPGVIEHDNPIIAMNGFYPQEALWYWDPGDNSETIQRMNATYTYPHAGYRDSFIVNVRAVDKRGCEYHGDTTIYVWKDFWAPNAFTPNNDGENDVFRFLGTEFMTDFHFTIFDRSGRIVFTGDDKDAAWDGTCDGKECGWGVYGYVVNYKSTFKGLNKGGERRGTVTLIR